MKATEINVIAELERYAIQYVSSGDTSVRVKCPFHDDTTPSAEIYVDSGAFKCYAASCGKSGNFVSLIAATANVSPDTVYIDLSTRYDLEKEERTINMAVVERHHGRIAQAGPLKRALHDKTITDEDIRKYRIGFDGNRITIPIFNGKGQAVNIRKYLPNAPSKDKMKNEKGYSRKRLYPYEQLQYEKIVIVGGEMKAIAGARALNKQGIGCITVTAGEGAWEPAFGPLFADKQVILCFDIDTGGRDATQKVGAALVNYAATIKDLLLPLDPATFPKGDVNDYLAQESDNSFVGLVMNAQRWVPKMHYVVKINETDEIEDVELSQAFEADRTNKRVRFKAVISAMHTSPFTVPSKVTVKCPRDQAYCGLCPVRHEKHDNVYPVQSEHPAILRMVGSNELHRNDAIRNVIGIPPVCKLSHFTATDYYNVEDVKLSPELDLSSRATERSMQPAVLIGKQLELNDSYKMTGRMHPHPANQQATLVVSEAEPTQDALSAFAPDTLDDLKVFSPAEWTVEAIGKKLNSLYADLTANVTRVYKRDDMHLLMDLVYHSPLRIQFDGRTIKGWVECLVIGDSGHGKSEVFERLMEYYGLGVKVDCANASVAGLHGGLQQIGGKWYVTWGVIPMHDRRLVGLEELKRASPEVLARLTDMRSSGKAEIYKIEKRSTHARTRLLAISNPRSELPMRSYNYGVEAVKELMGSLEDVRRFDAVMGVCAEDINANEFSILTSHRPQIPNEHTAELCRKLILWSWTRLDAQVAFEPQAEQEVLDVAIRLANRYSDAVPIVDRGSQRLKVARLSAALAARTFSCDDNNDSLLIRLCHVQFIEQFLMRIYDSRALGYLSFSTAQQQQNEITDIDEVKIRILALQTWRDFVTLMLNANAISVDEIMDWGSLLREQAQELVSLLVRKYALWKRGKFYRKSPALTELLKELEALSDEEKNEVFKPKQPEY